MKLIWRIFRYQLRDVARSRWLIGYALFFLVAAQSLLTFSGGNSKALLGLSNIVLLVIPLATMMFATMYMYSSREFIELLLAQPIARSRMYAGILLGLMVPLAGAFVIGAGIPLLLTRTTDTAFVGRAVSLVAAGAGLSVVFTALAMCIAARVEDRIRGLALTISLWLLMAVVYDAGVLFLATVFANYPLERAMLGLMVANPIDLARVALLLQFDISALMSYTGAVFETFFTRYTGFVTIIASLVFWAVVPAWLGMRAFSRRDF